jgi:hypothetical protein
MATAATDATDAALWKALLGKTQAEVKTTAPRKQIKTAFIIVDLEIFSNYNE